MTKIKRKIINLDSNMEAIELLLKNSSYKKAFSEFEMLEFCFNNMKDCASEYVFLDCIKFFLLKSDILLQHNRIDEGIYVAKIAFRSSLDIDNVDFYFKSLLQLIRLSLKKRDVDEAIYYLKLLGEKLSKLENNQDIITNEFQLKQITADYYLYKGKYSNLIKNNVDAIANFTKSMEIYKEINFREKIGVVELEIGQILLEKGELVEAENHFTRSLLLIGDNNKKDKACIFQNLGNVYRFKGELKKAVENFSYAKSIFIDLEDSFNHAYSLLALAMLSKKLGHEQVPLQIMNDAISICEKHNFEKLLSILLYQKIILLVDYTDQDHNQDQISLYEEDILSGIERLKKIGNKKGHEPDQSVLYLLAKAVTLKRSYRIIDRAEAQKILYQLLENNEIFSLELRLSILLHLSECLLFELKITKTNSTMQELKNVSKLLNEFVSEPLNKSQNFRIESYLLKSQIALLEGDKTNAKFQMKKALEMTRYFGMESLKRKIITKSKELNKLIDDEDLIEDNLTLNGQINKIGLVEQLFDSFRSEIKYLELSEDKPVFFLILNESGIAIYSKVYERKRVNDQLISGFISAINQIGQAVFSLSPGNISKISFDNYTISLIHDKPLTFVYSYSGQTFFANQRLKEIVKRLKNSQWDNLVTTSKTGKLLNKTNIIAMDEILDQMMVSKTNKHPV